MTYQQNRFDEFVNLVDQHAEHEGVNLASIEGFGTFKATTPQQKKPSVDLPALWIVGQGKKNCYAGNTKYEFCPGNAVVMFYPMSVAVEYIEASPDVPFLVAGVLIDLARLSDVLLRIDCIEGAAPKPVSADPSGVFTFPVTDSLLAPFIRLLEASSDPKEAAFLGEAIVDEIYFRLLTNERGGELRYLLQQRGEIQRISRAVQYIHQNLDQPVSVEGLAEMVHMGQTSFYENFKNVMHVSPLKYAKSVKLDRARVLIKEGKKVNEAGFMVGYNSPAQFSREYKRHFGYAPSAT